MSQEELDEKMPVWQNHERRITTLEVNFAGVAEKLDRVDQTIKEGNQENKEMLNTINTRMVDEFFGKKKMDRANMWKLVLSISGGLAGGGGLLYIIIEKLTI